MGQSPSKQTFRELLASVPLTTDGLLSSFGEVIAIDSRSSLTKAYRTLLDHNITSAPVYDHTAQDYIGLLDIRDLAQFAVLTYEQQYKEHVEKKLAEHFDHKESETLPVNKIAAILETVDQHIFDSVGELPKFEKVKPHFEAEIKQAPDHLAGFFGRLGKSAKVGVGKKTQNLVVQLSARHSFHFVQASDSLLEVCEVLATGVHSVPVMERTSKNITNIVTQASVVRFLRANKSEELQEFLSHLIGDLGTSPVIAVGKNFTVYCALKIMADRYISGVAVVDTEDGNKLIGTFSTSDLKAWFAGDLNFETLTQTVSEYLANRKMVETAKPTDSLLIKRAKESKPKSERPAVVTCIPTETLDTLVTRLDTYKIHRIYIKHPRDQTVLSVVCLKDLIRLMLSTDHLIEVRRVQEEEKKHGASTFVCECHHCQGKFSFASQATVDSHLNKWGKYVKEWASSHSLPQPRTP